MKEFRHYCLIGLFLMGFYPGISQTQESALLTLEEAIRIALENNYDIRIAENDREILDNNYGYGKYNFLPTIGASATRNFDIQDIEQGRTNERGDTVIIVNNAQANQLSASINLEWTIFDGLGMFITYERIKELKRAGVLNLKAAIESSIAEVSQAYYQVVLEKGRIAVLKNTLELSEKRLEIAKAVYEVGRSSKLEFLSAQVDRNADQSELINQEELYYNAKVNLNNLIGRKVDIDFEVLNEIEPGSSLVLQDLESQLLEQNPNLKLSEVNQHISFLETKEIRAERFPEINLNSGYRHNESESQASFANYNNVSGFYYGLSANISIFNGMDISRRIQNSKIQQETSEIIYNQTKSDLLANLNNVFVAYKNSLRLVGLETNNFELARESEDIAYERYKLGVANFLELREAQRNAVAAESRLLNAAYNAKVAEIELLRLSGQIMQ